MYKIHRICTICWIWTWWWVIQKNIQKLLSAVCQSEAVLCEQTQNEQEDPAKSGDAGPRNVLVLPSCQWYCLCSCCFTDFETVVSVARLHLNQYAVVYVPGLWVVYFMACAFCSLYFVSLYIKSCQDHISDTQNIQSNQKSAHLICEGKKNRMCHFHANANQS